MGSRLRIPLIIDTNSKPVSESRPMTESSKNVPADLQAALEKNAAARSAFDALPPSHQREYVKWINEAKKPETRNRRISQTIERLVKTK